MYPTPPALTLMPKQSRMINATEGFRLEVRSGCLWLTRPSEPGDHFLVAGDAIELHENHVLIQSDRHPGRSDLMAARYVLVPLTVPSRVQPNSPPHAAPVFPPASARQCLWALADKTHLHAMKQGPAWATKG